MSPPFVSRRRFRLALALGLLLLPLLLFLQAPVVAALLPGAILAVAGLDHFGALDEAPEGAALVDRSDAAEGSRIARALPVTGRSRVIEPKA